MLGLSKLLNGKALLRYLEKLYVENIKKKKNVPIDNFCPLFSQPFSAPAGIPIPYAYGICVPSSCTAAEVESGLNKVLNGSMLSVKANPLNCRTKEPRTLGTEQWVVMYVIFSNKIYHSIVCSQ